MSTELIKYLKPGDQIIATEDAYFKTGHYSQLRGDILMVNNPNVFDSVGGFGLNGTAYNGRHKIGLGGSLKAGTFRRATPDDPGYMATREQWLATIRDTEIRKLHDKVFMLKATLVTVITLLITVVIHHSH